MSDREADTAGLPAQSSQGGPEPLQATRFESLVAALSNALVMSPRERLDEEIVRWMKCATEFLGLEGAAIVQFSEDGRSGTLTHSWMAPGLASLPEALGHQEWPWVFERIKEGRCVGFSSPDELPPEAAVDIRTYHRLGVVSCLSVPLACDGVAAGSFGMGTVTRRHEWPESVTSRIRLVGELLGGALARKRAEQALRASRERYALAVDGANDGLWDWDLRGGEVYFSPRCKQMLGYAGDEMVDAFAGWEQLLHPEDRERALGLLTAYLDGRVAAYHLEHRLRHRDGSYRWILSRGKALRHADGRAYRMAGSHTDITEHKQRELELTRACEEIRRLKDQLQAENVYLREELSIASGHAEIVGTSDAIRRVISQAHQVAATDSTVLILGETGTGKELLAHFIHGHSLRKNRPLITTNLATIPATLIESELFGREKGAYTGSLTRQIGRFEAADGGTIFLDEIGEAPAETQAKLLRVLQTGEFERLGSSKTIRVGVRVIAATNRDLAAAVRAGSFREDLFYRLNVFPITVPPLRDRRDDIPQLVWAFIREFGAKMGKPIDHIKRANMAALQAYGWPGNIRELRNVIERSMILARGGELAITLPGSGGVPPAGSALMCEVERRHLQKILEMTGGRIRGRGGAAELLGLKPSTLYSRLKKLDIRRQERAAPG